MKFRFWRRGHRERNLQEEIEGHLQRAADDRIERGESPAEARHAAHREFGNVDLVREVTRDQWGWRWLENLLQDIRYGARVLRKNPGFTVIAVLTLALGIGANTAIFTAVNAILLHPLPFRKPAQLVKLVTFNPHFPNFRLGLSPADLADIRARVRSLEGVAYYNSWEANWTGAGEPRRIDDARVSEDFFSTLGVQPVLGRFFLPSEQAPGKDRVAVISEGIWKSNFGGGNEVLGQRILLDGNSYIIVGVAPAWMNLPSQETKVWLPLALTDKEKLQRSAWMHQTVARLQPGATLPQAQAEINTLMAQIAKSDPLVKWSIRASLLEQEATRRYGTALLVLFGAATLVLLIACANVANLFLARGAGREREMAIRTAMGARAWRIVRQLLVESGLVSLAGGGAGILMAVWGVDAVRVLAPKDEAPLAQLHPDWAMAAFAVGCSLLVGILSGLAPALQSLRLDLNTALKGASGAQSGGSGPSRHRLGNSLVVMEVALSLALLTGSLLLVKNLVTLTHVQTGIRTDRMLTMQVLLPKLSYPDDARRAAFVSQLLSNVESIPGVVHAVATNHPVLAHISSMSSGLQFEGHTNGGQGYSGIEYSQVSPDYFATLGIPVRQGRAFTAADRLGAPQVAVVNESMARLIWRNDSPLGARTTGETDEHNKPMSTEIVGVVADSRDISLQNHPEPEFYVPLLQQPSPGVALIVQTAANPMALLPAAKQQIWLLDKALPVTNVRTLEESLSALSADPRFQSQLLGTFALLGMLIAIVGLYGVMAYFVAQRTREIAIRLALGAQKIQVLGLVLRRGLLLTLTGVALGLGCAAALTHAMQGLLFEVKPLDPMVFVISALAMMGATLLACAIPARRATKVDPMVALRYE